MIVVAGGTGTLGKRLLPRLVERGGQVRALVRRANAPLPDGVEPSVGDITDPEAVRRVVQGAATVVCGADPRTVDGLGTRALIAAAANEGVERFVLVSVFHARADHPNELQRGQFTQAKTRFPGYHLHRPC